MLWLHKDDADEALGNIRSCMPAAWDPTVQLGRDSKGVPLVGNWVAPDAATLPLHNKLFRIIKRKQMHNCTEVGAFGCRHESLTCAGHFPQPIHKEKLPSEDPVQRCFRYYCPGYEHRNVGSYIPVGNSVQCDLSVG